MNPDDRCGYCGVPRDVHASLAMHLFREPVLDIAGECEPPPTIRPSASENVARAMQGAPPKHGEELARYMFYVGRESYSTGPFVMRMATLVGDTMDMVEVPSLVTQDAHGGFGIECNLPACSHLTDELTRALRDLLNDTWEQDPETGGMYCGGCGGDVGMVSATRAPGDCGSPAEKCSVVRACIALGMPVAKPGAEDTRKLMDERLEAARIAAIEAERSRR